VPACLPFAKPFNVMRQLKKGDREMANSKPNKEEKQVELVKFRNVLLATINYYLYNKCTPKKNQIVYNKTKMIYE
jgi:hypothetical protein